MDAKRRLLLNVPVDFKISEIGFTVNDFLLHVDAASC